MDYIFYYKWIKFLIINYSFFFKLTCFCFCHAIFIIKDFIYKIKAIFTSILLFLTSLIYTWSMADDVWLYCYCTDICFLVFFLCLCKWSFLITKYNTLQIQQKEEENQQIKYF